MGEGVDKNLEKEVDKIPDFDQKIVNMICKISRLKNTVEEAPKVKPIDSCLKSAKIKFPKISLKKINGNHVSFLSFNEQFISSLHNNNDLSDIKKFGSVGMKTAVVSTINGDANVPFYKELGKSISCSTIVMRDGSTMPPSFDFAFYEQVCGPALYYQNT